MIVCPGLLGKAVGLCGSQSHRKASRTECRDPHCTVSMPASWGGETGVLLLMLPDASCMQVCSNIPGSIENHLK